VIRVGGFKIFDGPSVACPVSIRPWIKQFCAQTQFQWYCELELDFANDWFNHYGMKETVEHFDEALDLICDRHFKKWTGYEEDRIRAIHEQAVRLYGLLHSRWILQPKGMARMKEKFQRGVFGQCPRFACNGQYLLPVGESQIPNRHSCKLFCPQCRDLYRPEGVWVDGAHFGTAFPHIFLVEFPQFNTKKDFKPHKPNVFGFHVFEGKDQRPVHGDDGTDSEESEPERPRK
jgi:casein kinase II subunit beta